MLLRALHPRRDLPLFHVVWDWRASYPKRVRQWDMVKDFAQWWGMMANRVSIAVFDPCLEALVSLEHVGEQVYEVHVDCRRGVNPETLIVALLNLRKTVFEQWGAREVFAGVVSRNCGIIRIAEECGFTRDGVEEQVGKLRFIRLRLTKEEYVFDQNKFHQRLIDEHLHADAGCVVAGH